MTEKKKKYLIPEMRIVEINAADIICTSLQPQELDPWHTPELDPNSDPFDF